VIQDDEDESAVQVPRCYRDKGDIPLLRPYQTKTFFDLSVIV